MKSATQHLTIPVKLFPVTILICPIAGSILVFDS